MVYGFYDGLTQDTQLPTQTKEVVWNLFRLFAWSTINNRSREFDRSKAISSEQLDKISDLAILDVMRKIRPHAVKLVDSWKLPDYLLDR